MKCAPTILLNARIAATLLLFAFLAAGVKAQQTMSPSDVAYCQAHTTDIFCLRGGTPAPQPLPALKPAPVVTTNTQSDCRTISFAVATPNGVQSYYPGWIDSWVKKNGKKFPNVCFAQNASGKNPFVIIMSTSRSAFAGLQVVRVTTTTPFSGGGSGTVTDNYGGMWQYTYSYSGTVTTSENVATPYVINSNTLFATAYDSYGTIVAEGSHVYSSQSGGDPYNSLGYNLGSALAAINARGRMLTGVVKTVAGRQ